MLNIPYFIGINFLIDLSSINTQFLSVFVVSVLVHVTYMVIYYFGLGAN